MPKFIVLLIAFMIFGTGLSKANELDPAIAAPYIEGQKLNMQKMIAGTSDLSEYARYILCKNIKKYLSTELGKVLYNDDFQEIKSEEHVRDIEELKQNILATEDCIERFKIWVAYDDKWYKAEREKKFAARKALEEEWIEQVEDTGAQVWDGVINGTFLSIPREYIWFGSRKPDGLQAAMNLQFFYPDMSARPSTTPEHAGKDRNISGILREQFTVSRPCIGYDNVKNCAKNLFQFGFNDYYDCPRYSGELGVGNYSLWRGICKLKAEPKYSEDVGMWFIKEHSNSVPGYYEGHPIFPDYYLKCKEPPYVEGLPSEYHTCKSALKINDGLYFKYSFPRELFWKHREIHDAVRAKIESFIVKRN